MGDAHGTVHFVGVDVQIGALLRQRCAWCGDVLLDYDLERLAVPVGEERQGPATWPVGTLVAVDGNATWVVDHDAVDPLPENTCAALLADLETRFKEALAAGKTTLVGETGPVWIQFVITWHPLNGAPSVEVPLGQHWVFPAESCGEFRLSTREVLPPAGEAPEVPGA